MVGEWNWTTFRRVIMYYSLRTCIFEFGCAQLVHAKVLLSSLGHQQCFPQICWKHYCFRFRWELLLRSQRYELIKYRHRPVPAPATPSRNPHNGEMPNSGQPYVVRQVRTFKNAYPQCRHFRFAGSCRSGIVCGLGQTVSDWRGEVRVDIRPRHWLVQGTQTTLSFMQVVMLWASEI